MNYSNVTVLDERRSVHENVLWAIVLILIMLTAIIGNIVVIVSIFKFNHLRDEVANLYIVNLSVTDLSSSLVVMLSTLVTFLADEWLLGVFWCYFVCAANYCLIIVSMLTLFFISLDRYIAILQPLHYNIHITKRRVLIMISYAWFQGIAFAVIPVVYHWIEFDYWEVICAISWYKQREQAIFYVVFAFLLCFFLPGLLLIYCYYCVWTVAQKQHNEIQRLTGMLQHHEHMPHKQRYSISSKAVKSLLIVVLAYFLCMTPFSCTKLYKVSIDYQKSIPGYLNLVSSILAFCSSAANPLIYGIFRKDFRKAYVNLWLQVLHRNSIESSVNVELPSVSANSIPQVYEDGGDSSNEEPE